MSPFFVESDRLIKLVSMRVDLSNSEVTGTKVEGGGVQISTLLKMESSQTERVAPTLVVSINHHE